MAKKSNMFVFYDTETTGLDEDFSQIVQIGLIPTDAALEGASGKKLACRISPWVIPSPGSSLLTGLMPEFLKQQKLSSYEMMREVDGYLRAQPEPRRSAGYNSLSYDEPILAQNLHQNLLDPTLTSSGHNGRVDIMILVKAVALYMPGALKLDILNGFKTSSLTLQNVARQNGVVLSEEDAHDAMNDIKATVGVAKVIRTLAPQIWEQMIALATVKGVDEFLESHEVFTYLPTYSLGKKNAAVMTSLVEREGSSTQALFDLRADPAPYLNMTAGQLKDVFLLKEKDRPFILLRKENQPVLMPMELSAPVLSAADDRALFERRAKTIQANKAFLKNVQKAALLAKQEKEAKQLPEFLPEKMIDEEVAAPVKKRLDKWAQSFHDAVNWHDRAAVTKNFYTRFKADLAQTPSLGRFAQFAERLIYEHAPQELSAEKQVAIKKQIAERLLNPDLDAPYMTVAKARQELAKIEGQRAQGGKWAHVTDDDINALKRYYVEIEKLYSHAGDVIPQPAKSKPTKKRGPKN